MVKVVKKCPERGTLPCYSWHGDLQMSLQTVSHVPKRAEMSAALAKTLTNIRIKKARYQTLPIDQGDDGR